MKTQSNLRARGLSRRALLAGSLAAASLPVAAADRSRPAKIVDTHMHVWANDASKYPFPHPYASKFEGPPHEATVEMLLEDMGQHHCQYAVLVQVIYHGWDNSYVADCAKRYPRRLRAHGLIDPTDLKVAEKLEYWVKEHGLHGMRFSPIYYQDGKHGGDRWLNAAHTHKLWKKAEALKAVFNFFIAPRQLTKLETMVRAYPDVPVVIDHLSQMDLGQPDPEPDMRRLLKMANYPNIWVKVSELASVSRSGKYPFEDAYPWVKRVYEAFGPDRLLFGTGYPGAARAHYKRPTLDAEIALIDRYSFMTPADRAKLLGENAMKLWNFA